jgi:hypothetical protein
MSVVESLAQSLNLKQGSNNSMKIKFLFSLLAIFVATGILTMSLLSSAAAYTNTPQVKWNERQLYFSDQILPDHVLYPALMAADKVKLETSSDLEKVYLKTTYANLRLEATQELLDKGNQDLALTTLTKAEKYLLEAASDALCDEIPDHTREHVLKTMLYHHLLTQKLKTQFDENQWPVIDQLNEECKIFHTQLREKNRL